MNATGMHQVESQNEGHRQIWHCQERLDVEPRNTSQLGGQALDRPRGYSARRASASLEDLKQLKARDICKGCKPTWRGRDAVDTWIWLVTP